MTRALAFGTFCRGWGNLPFDRSSPDLTAHAIRAWIGWLSACEGPLQQRINAALQKAIRFLLKNQLDDGSWIPLWFGNQHAPKQTNATYGTSRVVHCLAELLAGALDDGLGRRRPLEDALASYEQTRNEKVMPMYDLTCQLATLAPPPPEMQQLFGALQRNQADTNSFLGVMAGGTRASEFFAPENVRRIVAGVHQKAAQA